MRMEGPGNATATDRSFNRFRAKFEGLPEGADIPKFVRRHNADLRFPDKVSILSNSIVFDTAKMFQWSLFLTITAQSGDDAI
jgi:hypothetical protein